MNVNKIKTESFNSVQLTSLAKENRLLRENLQYQQKGAIVIPKSNKSSDDKEFVPSTLDSTNVEPSENPPVKATEITSEISEVILSLR